MKPRSRGSLTCFARVVATGTTGTRATAILATTRGRHFGANATAKAGETVAAAASGGRLSSASSRTPGQRTQGSTRALPVARRRSDRRATARRCHATAARTQCSAAARLQPVGHRARPSSPAAVARSCRLARGSASVRCGVARHPAMIALLQAAPIAVSADKTAGNHAPRRRGGVVGPWPTASSRRDVIPSATTRVAVSAPDPVSAARGAPTP